jgi:chaperonin GroES
VKLRPLDDKVVIRRKEAETRTPGGVYLPDKAKETPREGIIVAVGPGRLLENGTRLVPQIKVEDRVLFAPYAGNVAEVDGAEVIIMAESDILGVLEEDPAMPLTVRGEGLSRPTFTKHKKPVKI